MNVKLTVQRRTSTSVILQVLVGGALGFVGALTDNLELLILGVWLILQGQLHQMWDEMRERLP